MHAKLLVLFKIYSGHLIHESYCYSHQFHLLYNYVYKSSQMSHLWKQISFFFLSRIIKWSHQLIMNKPGFIDRDENRFRQENVSLLRWAIGFLYYSQAPDSLLPHTSNGIRRIEWSSNMDQNSTRHNWYSVFIDMFSLVKNPYLVGADYFIVKKMPMVIWVMMTLNKSNPVWHTITFICRICICTYTSMTVATICLYICLCLQSYYP